jgi:hypothetical protein
MDLYKVAVCLDRVCRNVRNMANTLLGRGVRAPFVMQEPASEELVEHLFAIYDSHTDAYMEQAWAGEMARLPPQLKLCNIHWDEYVMRQWMCRKLHLGQAAHLNKKDRALFNQRPTWQCYEMRSEGLRFPVRVIGDIVLEGRLLSMVKTKDGMLSGALKPEQLHLVLRWDEQHMEMIRAHPECAGVFMDPLGIVALRMKSKKNAGPRNPRAKYSFAIQPKSGSKAKGP